MSILYDALQSAVGDKASDTALVYRDTYLSWRGLIHRVDRRARDLSSLGITRGAWVGVMLGNIPELVITGLALSKLEAVFVPLDPTTSARDLDMVLDAAPLRALITRPRGGESLTSAASLGALRVSSVHAMPARFVPESRRRLPGTLLTCSLYRRQPPQVTDGSTPSVVLFTLDAGGDPKGVVRGEVHLEAIAHSLLETLEVVPGDRILCAAPLHHGYSFDLALLPFLFRHTTLILEEDSAINEIARLIREARIDIFAATPATFSALARVSNVRPRRQPKARFVSAGSPLPASVAESFHRRYGVRLVPCHHSTEAGPVALERAGRERNTVGKPLAGVELRIATADARTLPMATVGPLWVRAGGVSGTFIPELAALKSAVVPVGRVSAEGWLRTGDLGYLDRHGRLVLTGREDDLVEIDGRRVALGEVEGCLEGFAKVRAAQARVIIDELGGPRVVARVVRSERCAPKELIDHCARNLAPYKVPRQIEFCESLSQTEV